MTVVVSLARCRLVAAVATLAVGPHWQLQIEGSAPPSRQGSSWRCFVLPPRPKYYHWQSLLSAQRISVPVGSASTAPGPGGGAVNHAWQPVVRLVPHAPFEDLSGNPELDAALCAAQEHPGDSLAVWEVRSFKLPLTRC